MTFNVPGGSRKTDLAPPRGGRYRSRRRRSFHSAQLPLDPLGPPESTARHRSLPHRFGFLANRRRATLLPLCQRLLADQPMPQPPLPPPPSPLVSAVQNVPLPCLSSKDSLSLLLGNSRSGVRSSTLPDQRTMTLSAARASAPTAVVFFTAPRPLHSGTNFREKPSSHRLQVTAASSTNRTYTCAPPTTETNKLRNAPANPIAPPRPPRQRLRPNPPIASAPAGSTWVHAATRRRRTCREGTKHWPPLWGGCESHKLPSDTRSVFSIGCVGVSGESGTSTMSR
jgi:hypothetical protein